MTNSRVAVYLHLVWATWDRLPLLTETVGPRVRRAVAAKAVALGAEVLAIGGVEDHIHLLVRLPSTLCVAELVRQAKGVSTHLMTHEVAPGEFFKWQGTYGAFSVSPRQVGQVCDYIARQPEHHAAGGAVVRWEERVFRPASGSAVD